MSIRDELERALRRGWNSGDLKVYADHLMSIGDARGELVALDLRPSGEEAWRRRRAELLDAWLGPELAARAGKRVQHGVVHELRAPRDVLLLATPLGDVARGFTTAASGYGGQPTPPQLVASLEALAERPRPWLSRLVIEYPSAQPLDAKLRDALVAATPNLVDLYAFHQRPFDAFHHPSLERMYVTPMLQKPPTGVPTTTAEVIEILDYGWGGRWVTERENIETYLEAIELAPDCNELYAAFGDLVGPHDSLFAMIVRMHEAGIVELDGPFVQLSATGRALLRWPEIPPQRRPSRMPPNLVGDRKWVLWIESAELAERELLIAGLVWMQSELLVDTLAMLPLETHARTIIHAYLAFLTDVIDAGEWEDVAYTEPLPELVAALEQPLAFRRLHDFDLAPFMDFGDAGAWSQLENVVATLDRIAKRGGRAMFRVAWGF